MKKAKKHRIDGLDDYEQSIEDALDYKTLKRPSVAKQRNVRSGAKSTLQSLKSARANIRISEGDLQALRMMADQAGLSYQTLINHIIHLYVTGHLINAQEVKRMVNAGLFDQRKTSNG